MESRRLRGGRVLQLLAAVAFTGLVSAAPLPSPSCPPDWNDDEMVSVPDIFAFLSSWFAGDADYNNDGQTTVPDIFAFLSDWFAFLSTGCPSNLDLMASTTSGGLGTVVTLTLSPATSPNIFDSGTTAYWSGRYVPLIGAPTDPFMITFTANDIIDVSASQAKIVVGSGTGALPAGIADLGPGVFEGGLSVVLSSGVVAATAMNFTPTLPGAKWRKINYPDGPGGLDPPMAGPEPTGVPLYLLSLTPDPLNPPEAVVWGATSFHHAIAMSIEDNADSLSLAPLSLSVDLVLYDQSGEEVSRLQSVPLARAANSSTYFSDLSRPIILVDVLPDQQAYPDFIFFLIETVDGSIAVVPSH